MPTYVYRFVDTGETIEVQQSFTDDALTEAAHPSTGALMPVKKVFTPVGITFKGGGFYKNDSRGSSSASPALLVDGDKRHQRRRSSSSSLDGSSGVGDTSSSTSAHVEQHRAETSSS